MNKILTIILIFCGFNAFSQELPFSKHYIFDQTLLNPALGAKYNFIAVKLVGSEQWIKMPQNPELQSLSFNMKFKNKMGFNATALNEKYGAVSNFGLKLSYFYYIKLNTKGDFISFGLSGPFFQYAFDLSNLKPEEIDPAMSTNSLQCFVPNASTGVYFQKKNVALGFSAGNLFPYKSKFYISDDEPFKTRTYFFYGEYRFKNEINTFAVVPSAIFYIDEQLNRQVNINTKLIFNNVFWVGLSYRDAISTQTYSIHNILTLVGFNFFKRLNLAYGYDFGLFSARNILGGTHNLMIGYNFIKRDKDVPMYF